MLCRMLLATLVLLGHYPAGVCTCQASEHRHPGLMEHITDHPLVAPDCAGQSVAFNPCSTTVQVKITHDSEPAPPCHHRDCPAANPLSSLVPAVSTASPITLTADEFILSQLKLSYGSSAVPKAVATLFRIHVDPLPRYLEFLSLLI